MAYKRTSAQPVVEGGTGASSFTAYSVITGGTTSTNPLQNVSGVGSSGQVLASAGASALPAWSGGGWVLIQSQTASTSASLVFSTGITTTYNVFAVTFKDVLPVTDAVSFFMDWSTDGGSTYLNSNYQTGVSVNNWNSAAMFNATSATTNLISNTIVNNTRGLSGTIYLYELPSAAAPFYHGTTYYNTTLFGPINTTCYGLNTASTGINAIKFSFSSGNIASGTISLYGINK